MKLLVVQWHEDTVTPYLFFIASIMCFACGLALVFSMMISTVMPLTNCPAFFTTSTFHKYLVITNIFVLSIPRKAVKKREAWELSVYSLWGIAKHLVTNKQSPHAKPVYITELYIWQAWAFVPFIPVTQKLAIFKVRIKTKRLLLNMLLPRSL